MTIAGLAVAALVQYVASKGAHLVRRAGRDLDKGVDDGLDRVYDAVKARIVGDRSAERTLRELEAEPTDARVQGRLENALEGLVESDPAFGAHLSALLDVVAERSSLGRVDIRDSGAVALQGDVNLRGKNVAGRDLTVGDDLG
jgi:hypothetical protein